MTELLVKLSAAGWLASGLSGGILMLAMERTAAFDAANVWAEVDYAERDHESLIWALVVSAILGPTMLAWALPRTLQIILITARI